MTYPQPAPPERPRTTLALGVVIGIAAGALVLGVIVGALGATVIGFAARTVATASKPVPKSGFAAALKECDVDLGSDITDGGDTLSLDGEGDDDDGLEYDSEFCVLDQLDIPNSIEQKMGETRALDGRQSDSWGDYEISWSYHPDDGLDAIVEFQH